MSDPSAVTQQSPTDLRRAVQLLAWALALGIAPLWGANVVASAAGFLGSTGSLAEAGVAFCAFPVIAFATILFLFAPGLIVALALDWGQSAPRWLAYGYGLGLVVLAVACGVVEAWLSGPLTGPGFLGLIAALDVAAFGLLTWRIRRHTAPHWPLASRENRFVIATAVALSMAVLTFLAPHFLWENFNGDGAHAFEAARLVLFRPFPFWEPGSGAAAAFPGFSSMLFAYPASWFIRVFGELEVAARLPYVPALIALFGGVLALGRKAGGRCPGPLLLMAVGLMLFAFSLAMAFAASYSPYSADLAMPGSQDTQFMAVLIATLAAFVNRETRPVVLFTGLALIALPSGLLILAFWVGAVLMAWRPVPVRRLVVLALAIVGWSVVIAMLARALPLFGQPAPGGEYGVGSLARYFAFLQFTDYRRLGYMLLPSGVITAGSLAAWRWQDPVARALTLTTVGYFLFFFVQAYVSLHHFVPAMILPVAIHLRVLSGLGSPMRQRLARATAVAAALAVVVSVPRHPTPYRGARQIARTMEIHFAGYERHAPEAFRHLDQLRALFPADWDAAVPEDALGGSELVWNYYAHDPRTESDRANYVLQPDTGRVPDGWSVVSESNGARVLVRSDSIWHSHLALRPRTRTQEGPYAVPRGMLFRSESLPDGPRIISTPRLLERIGVDPAPLVERFTR